MRKPLLIIWILSLFLAASQAYAGLSFLKTVTEVSEDKEDVLFRQRFYSEGDMLRIEEEASGIEGNPGVTVYDFPKKKFYTIMLDVKLYIERDIGIEKESLMFEMPPEKKYVNYKDIKVVRTKLGEDTIEGHPAVRYEVKVVVEGEKGKEKEELIMEQYLLWVAEDLKDMPVKYEFKLPNDRKRIIKYTDIKTDAIDPSFFLIPEGYMPISPF